MIQLDPNRYGVLWTLINCEKQHNSDTSEQCTKCVARRQLEEVVEESRLGAITSAENALKADGLELAAGVIAKQRDPMNAFANPPERTSVQSHVSVNAPK